MVGEETHEEGLVTCSDNNVPCFRNDGCDLDRRDLAEGDGCIAATALYAGQTMGSQAWQNFLTCLSGTGCAPPTASQPACLCDHACGGVPTYFGYQVGGTDCGKYTRSTCSATLYPNNLRRLGGCNHFNAGAQHHIVYLHEMLHSCDYDHPDDVFFDKSCNNTVSCCMLRATGFLAQKQRCRPL